MVLNGMQDRPWPGFRSRRPKTTRGGTSL